MFDSWCTHFLHFCDKGLLYLSLFVVHEWVLFVILIKFLLDLSIFIEVASGFSAAATVVARIWYALGCCWRSFGTTFDTGDTAWSCAFANTTVSRREASSFLVISYVDKISISNIRTIQRLSCISLILRSSCALICYSELFFWTPVSIFNKLNFSRLVHFS